MQHPRVNLRDFDRRESDGTVVYTCRRLEGVRHGFSTRVDLHSAAPFSLSSTPWDADSRVSSNRRRFLAVLGLPPDSLSLVSQVHSDKVHIISRDSGRGNPLAPGDALATREAGVAVGVRTADCLPVLLSDPGTGSVAAVHAGWRGMLAGVGRKTVEVMAHELGADAGRLVVAVGPGIGACCLEVGPEVVRAWAERHPADRVFRVHPADPHKRYLDLRAALEIQLSEAGVPPGNILDLQGCTRCRTDEFFSHRAEGLRAGRMLAVIAAPGASDS